VDVTVAVTHPLAWAPDHPHLYTFEVSLLQEGNLIDKMSEHFGFRTIQARDGRLFLNGQVLYLRGALDQDYYPNTICTPPSEEFLEDQMRNAKALGLNCLRCHVKIPDPRYYAVADRVGMLTWAELPFWQSLTDKAAQRARATLQGMVERDRHHPSIIAWTIVNESWGVDLVHDATHRAWLRETYHRLKEIDPARLVVDNSPCWPNFHIQTDLNDYHQYRTIPDHRCQWDEFVTTFASRPPWTFSPHTDAINSGQEPLIVSEFGNWGLPDADRLVDSDGRDPWWFETGYEWKEGAAYPHGVRERFHALHLDQVFGSWRAFVEATQWHQYAALKYEIESIRHCPEIAGYVITQLTDVHWECNGLLDMHRNAKVFYMQLAAINTDTVIIPKWERVAYWSGEPVHVDVAVAHGAGPDIENAQVRWVLSSGTAEGQIGVPLVRAVEVASVGTAVFAAPDATTAGVEELGLKLLSADGRVLASNHLILSIFPPRRGPVHSRSSLWAAQPELAERLSALGYKVAPDAQRAQAVVANRLDESLVSYVRHGGRLLLLAEEPAAIGASPLGVSIAAREGTPWAGDWISSFGWLRRAGPFGRIPGGPLFDLSFDRVIPEHVLVGPKPGDFEAQVYAGLFVGWINEPAALICQRSYGRGLAVLTTFRLTRDSPGSDPLATTLLDALIELTLGEGTA